MDFFNGGFRGFLVVDYISPSLQVPRGFRIPEVPQLISLEQILLIVLFIFLIVPLLNKRKDQKEEQYRVTILRWSAFIGSVALLVHFYRFISQIN